MKKIVKIMSTAAFALAFALGTAVADDKAVAINDQCPVKEGKAADGSKSHTHTVKFCCGNCKGKFEEEPAKYLSKVADAEEGACPLSGREVSDAQTAEIKIAVCCGGCVKKVAAEPAKYLKALAKS